jgi:hypothetical protein
MEATCCSETSFGFQRNIKGYVPGDRILRTDRCEGIETCITRV